MRNVLFHSWLVLDIHCAPCWGCGQGTPFLISPLLSHLSQTQPSQFSISSADGPEQSPWHCPHPQSPSTPASPEQRWTQCLHGPTCPFPLRADVPMPHGCSRAGGVGPAHPSCTDTGPGLARASHSPHEQLFCSQTVPRQLPVPDPSTRNNTAGLPLLTSSPSGWRQFTAGQMASSSSESSCSENDVSEGSRWLSLERCSSMSRSRSLSSLLLHRSFE